MATLQLGPYVGYQAMRGLMPLALCIHPLLYMAVVPSLGCCGQHCSGYRDSWRPEDAKSTDRPSPAPQCHSHS
ncbi:hypothetical protein P7K49_023536 [Saguinus oedipus]|uniref:Uncharacterized protein n=1 Tax=Saguinus oedipus TaxID=9490 RepID=A0ABQ9UMP2_SAGOE|nr:hypothetical protein P7K49_023536 [Saguinus oedipus]